MDVQLKELVRIISTRKFFVSITTSHCHSFIVLIFNAVFFIVILFITSFLLIEQSIDIDSLLI